VTPVFFVLDGVPTSTEGDHVLCPDEENGVYVRCDLTIGLNTSFEQRQKETQIARLASEQSINFMNAGVIKK
jgi:hypothetical protein